MKIDNLKFISYICCYKYVKQKLYLIVNYKITIEDRTELIDLRKLDTTKLYEMIQIAIEFENYEICSFIQKIINNKNK
jgi:hypothetical protein